MSRPANWLKLKDVSEEHSAIIFRVKQLDNPSKRPGLLSLRMAQHPRRHDLQLHSPDTLHDTISHYKRRNFLK